MLESHSQAPKFNTKSIGVVNSNKLILNLPYSFYITNRHRKEIVGRWQIKKKNVEKYLHY